jgi:hypothetical protein
MPEDTPRGVLDRVAGLAAADPHVRLELVAGTIREAGARVKSHWVPAGWFSVATFQEPGWRIEGKKTLGLELAEPAQPGGAWRLPDVIVYPTGGGTGILGMWKAFGELETLGVVGAARPRMVAVQSEATAPIVAAFAAGEADTRAGVAGATLAVGLNVPGGVGHFRVLEILRASGGSALAVAEAICGGVPRRPAHPGHGPGAGGRGLPGGVAEAARRGPDAPRRPRGGGQHLRAGQVPARAAGLVRWAEAYQGSRWPLACQKPPVVLISSSSMRAIRPAAACSGSTSPPPPTISVRT